MVNRENLFYKGKKNTYNFRQLDTIKSFARNSFSVKIVLDDADQDKVELVIQIMDFKNNTKPKNKEKNQRYC